MSDSITVISSVFPMAGFSARELEMLRAVDLDAATNFARAVYRAAKNDPRAVSELRELLDKALASEMKLSDWMREIASVYEWLGQRELSAELGDVVQYVGCAIEGSTLTAGHTITWYLEQYGFEMSVPLSKTK
ncbi:MAG: hypothetical protein ACK5Y6_06675 [Pseudomonadota bacterium]